MAEPLTYDMYPSETQEAFIMSEALENCIVGPRGEGKTEAGAMAMTVHASMQDKELRPIPWAILRDTWANLERTTLESFLKPRPGSFCDSIRKRIIVKDGGKQLLLPGMWHAWLFGIDSLGDLNKLQSMQLGGLWIEEPAPAAMEDIGSGISEETWGIGISSLRYPLTTQARAQITMNYPDEDHWSWVSFNDHPTENRRLFRIPKGENVHVSEQYRMNMAGALANRPDLLDRLVIGRPAQVQLGEAVTPEYHEDVHRSREVLNPIVGREVIRFWDGGLHPACVFGQFTASGRFHVLDSVQGRNIGMKQLIEGQVKPLIFSRYSPISSWRDTGDPTLNTPDDSDSNERPAEKIEKLLSTHFDPGESSWTARREAMREILTRMLDGKPAFQISRSDKIMHRCLHGGWHYKKDPSGKVIKDKPVKDIYSHPGDALSHGLAKILQIGIERTAVSEKAETEFNVFA